VSIFRPALTGSLIASLFCAGPVSSPAPAQGTAKPTLLVFITVDQLREDYLEKWRGQFTGGFKELLDGGAFFTNGHQDHAITETAPGHSTVMSGRFPRSTGITRNISAGVNGDPNAPLIETTGLSASPFRFRGTTLTDWLTAADARTRVLSVSVKDRGAILPIGRSKQPVYWYPAGNFTTSKYYTDTLPSWVKAFNARRLPEQYAGRLWELLLPEASYPEPDSVPIENNGRGVVFPKRVPVDSARAAGSLPGTPFMDEVLAAFALEGVERLNLGKGPETDLLAISFSSTDYIGHAYGPDSREIHDQILRLDRTLGRLFDSLFKLRDRGRVIVALTADHGVTPFPELSQNRYSPPPRRVNVWPALAAARAVLQRACADTAAADLESGSLIIERNRAGVSAALINAAADSFVAVARRIPGVLLSERFGALATRDLGKDAIARRWIQMFPPDVPVEAVVVLTPGSYWDPFSIALHGTPHDDDSHVPILFFGAPFKPGSYPQFARTVDLAPTLAQVLGVSPTEPLDGRVLTAALR
jgi:predicted AlkP superfamily pyrophosphatase or phosphodiesterase